jgi:rhodanese-related sulfurtransferase
VPSKKDLTPLTAREVAARRAEGWAPFVLDVRRADEAAQRSLPFTDARIAHREIGDHLDEIPRDRDVLVYCASGVRSRTAIGTLRAAGFRRLFNLEGGISAWVDPPVSRY